MYSFGRTLSACIEALSHASGSQKITVILAMTYATPSAACDWPWENSKPIMKCGHTRPVLIRTRQFEEVILEDSTECRTVYFGGGTACSWRPFHPSHTVPTTVNNSVMASEATAAMITIDPSLSPVIPPKPPSVIDRGQDIARCKT